MGSLRLSTVGSTAVVVCLSILLISLTEVDGWGKCDYRKGLCNTSATSSTCDEPCKVLDSKYHGGECLNVGGGEGICWCCRDYDAKSGAEKDSM